MEARGAVCPSGSWTGTRRYLIQYDTDSQRVNSRLLEDMGQGVDMGSAETLREFVRWAHELPRRSLRAGHLEPRVGLAFACGVSRARRVI